MLKLLWALVERDDMAIRALALMVVATPFLWALYSVLSLVTGHR